MFNDKLEISESFTVEPDYQFSDFVHELHNLYMIRLGMSISESSRLIVDSIRDIEHAVANNISAIEYFQFDLTEEEE